MGCRATRGGGRNDGARGRSVTAGIHPTALLDPGAEIGTGVTVGPFAIIGPGVAVGDGSRIEARAILERNTRLGSEVRIGVGSIIGGDPQDLKYAGEETWVEIGDRAVIREYTTVNRGTAASGTTRVGNDAYLMSYVHVAHDCDIGEGVIIANGTQLAGHVIVHERATISGLVTIHQFVVIGTFAFVGGSSRVPQDIPPFVKAVGNPIRLFGLNTVGLQRGGYSSDTIGALKKAYRMLFNSDLPPGEAVERIGRECAGVPEVDQLVAFLDHSRRGVPA